MYWLLEGAAQKRIAEKSKVFSLREKGEHSMSCVMNNAGQAQAGFRLPWLHTAFVLG